MKKCPSAYRPTHNIDIHVAVYVSKNAGLVFHHLYTWIINNKVVGKNLIGGKTWVFQTQKDMMKHMPYFTKEELMLALLKLEEFGYIIKKNLNKNKWDKTWWYALVDEPELIDNPNISNNSSEGRESPPSMVGKGNSHCISKEVSREVASKEKQAKEKKAPKPAPEIACLPLSQEQKQEEKLILHIVSECNSLKIGLTEKTIRQWSKEYTAVKVAEKIRLYVKRSKKQTIPSVGGWIRRALEDDYQDNLDTMALNRKYAEQFKRKCKWLILEKTGCYPEGTAKDFSYAIPHAQFIKLLEDYYKMITEDV